jgi:hypothetical protein
MNVWKGLVSASAEISDGREVRIATLLASVGVVHTLILKCCSWCAESFLSDTAVDSALLEKAKECFLEGTKLVELLLRQILFANDAAPRWNDWVCIVYPLQVLIWMFDAISQQVSELKLDYIRLFQQRMEVRIHTFFHSMIGRY